VHQTSQALTRGHGVAGLHILTGSPNHKCWRQTDAVCATTHQDLWDMPLPTHVLTKSGSYTACATHARGAVTNLGGMSRPKLSTLCCLWCVAQPNLLSIA
jgi:hypothetical protein